MGEKEIKNQFDVSEAKIKEVIHQAQGNYNTALQLLQNDSANEEFEEL